MDSRATGRGPSVLVADDDAFIREFLATALRPHFAVGRPLANGRQLLEAALAGTPDVIVTDLNMPVLGGLGAMLALRDCGRTVPFVIVSADDHLATRCFELGASAFVSKLDLGADLIPAVFATLSGMTYVSRSVQMVGMADGRRIC